MDCVIGFAFTPDPLPYTNVLLIRKIKPAWQAGLLNGVGGKIGDREEIKDEAPIQAMVREFEEETGVKSYYDDWDCYAIMHDGTGHHNVYCFESREKRLYEEAETMEIEELVRIPVSAILLPSTPLIPNLPSKIMLALDRDSWHRPTMLVYGGAHFGGASLHEAVKQDPKIDETIAQAIANGDTP